jgi:hypothetical protein
MWIQGKKARGPGSATLLQSSGIKGAGFMSQKMRSKERVREKQQTQTSSMRSRALKSLKASAGNERANSEVQAGH